jgi:hypothetical protein
VNQAASFALLGVGGMAVVKALTGASWADVIKGQPGPVASTGATLANTGVAGVGATAATAAAATASTPAGSKFNADAASLANFVVGSTDVGPGKTTEIAQRLSQLGGQLGVKIYSISAYRTPAHSVAVGGFADDPHTQGLAIDIGVGGLTRASAAVLTNAELASVGLWRPFDMNGQDPAEVNHIQLIGTD